MALPAEDHLDRVVRWQGALPPDLMEGLVARPAAAEAFDRLGLSEIRHLIRWIQNASSQTVRRGRVKRVLAGLSRPESRPPMA